MWRKDALPPGKTAISCKVVFKRKLDECRGVARYKAQLVRKAFLKKEGIDYYETFSPAVPLEVVLLVVGRCIPDGWHVHHADISTHSLTVTMIVSYLLAGITWYKS